MSKHCHLDYRCIPFGGAPVGGGARRCRARKSQASPSEMEWRRSPGEFRARTDRMRSHAPPDEAP